MYIGYQGNKIKFYVSQPFNEPTIEKWEETDQEYVLFGDEYVLKTDPAMLEDTKEKKYQECLEKAYIFQQNGVVEYKNCEFEMSDSNRKNLSDTEEALKLMGQESTIWNDKEDNLVELTLEDIQYIRLNLILARIQKLWIEQYPAYKQEIAEAETIEEVESIEIDYTIGE